GGIRGFHVTGVQTCALPISPSTTSGTAPGTTCPASWMRTRYWSDQKYGAVAGAGTGTPVSSVRAAVFACSTALLQCSMRACRPRWEERRGGDGGQGRRSQTG